MVGALEMQLWFRICVSSLIYRLSDHSWFNNLYDRFDEFNLLRIWDENVNFIIFHLLGKRWEIEHRLHRLYWTLKCFGIGYGLNWRCYSSLKPGTYIKGHASLPKSPQIGGLFTCHKNPSAPSALSRPLNVLWPLMRFSSKARGSFEAGITLPGHICMY